MGPEESKWIKDRAGMYAGKISKRERRDKLSGTGKGAVTGLTAGGILGAALGGKKNLIRGLQAGVLGGGAVGSTLGYLKGREKAKGLRPLRQMAARRRTIRDYARSDQPTAVRLRSHMAARRAQRAQMAKAAMVTGLFDELQKIATDFAPAATAAGRYKSSMEALGKGAGGSGQVKNLATPPAMSMPKAGDMGTASKPQSAKAAGIPSPPTAADFPKPPPASDFGSGGI